MSSFLSKLSERVRSLSPPKNHARNASSPDSVDDKRTIMKRRDFYESIDKCRSMNCRATLIVEGAKFFACKHQLAHASNYFRDVFLHEHHDHDDYMSDIQANTADEDHHKPYSHNAFTLASTRASSISNFYHSPAQQMTSPVELAPNEYQVVVGLYGKYPQKVQFQYFLEAVIPNPILRDITDETLEVLMRLSIRFSAQGLLIRCVNYMRQNAADRAPMTALYWLVWSVKFAYPAEAFEASMPVVARLPLTVLDDNRHLLTDTIFADLVAAKLRATYDQSVFVYQAIHQADHFSVEMQECPVCHRQGVHQQNIVVHCSPCQVMVACDACLKNKPCLCDPTMQYHAVYHCKHGSRVIGPDTMDCFCQKYNFDRSSKKKNCPGGTVDFKGRALSKDLTFKRHSRSASSQPSRPPKPNPGSRLSSKQHSPKFLSDDQSPTRGRWRLNERLKASPSQNIDKRTKSPDLLNPPDNWKPSATASIAQSESASRKHEIEIPKSTNYKASPKFDKPIRIEINKSEQSIKDLSEKMKYTGNKLLSMKNMLLSPKLIANTETKSTPLKQVEAPESISPRYHNQKSQTDYTNKYGGELARPPAHLPLQEPLSYKLLKSRTPSPMNRRTYLTTKENKSIGQDCDAPLADFFYI